MKRIIIVLLCVYTSIGCTYNNVRFFEYADIQENVNDDTVSIFVDASGSVYPKNGIVKNIDSAIKKDFFIFNLATAKDLNCKGVAANTEMQKICATNLRNKTPSVSEKKCYSPSQAVKYYQQIQFEFWEQRAKHIYQQVAGTQKELIFMLHGYNNDFEASKKNFDLLKEQVRKNASRADREFLFVNIHWDGFEGGPLSGAWSRAQSSGPLVGFKLRAFFNALSDQFAINGEAAPNITFFTHSSGAFIVGALFGNPEKALPNLSEPDGIDYCLFYRNRSGEDLVQYQIPKFKSIRIGMIAAATPTTTFNGQPFAEKIDQHVGLIANDVTLVFSMNKYDFALSKIFQVQNLNIFGAVGSGSDKTKYCKLLETLETRQNVDKVTAIHFEKIGTNWFYPINAHSLVDGDDGYLKRKWSTKLFFNAVLNGDYIDPHRLTVACP